MRLLYSIGHSTHPIEEFVALLKLHRIALLADVRSYPSSRRWPQFNQAALEKSVEDSNVAYQWLPALGGRRRSRRSCSPHSAWEVQAFRAYADYADSPDFAAGLQILITLAEERSVAFMCSEGLWWQCHRRIVADHLSVRGFAVRHIMPDGTLADHRLPDFARVDGDRLIYDGGQPPLTLK
jgi:uncharacterized protein (DUF488 family)